MNLNKALTRAKRIEDALRERAFLPINEAINGVTVRQFTLRHLTILFEIRSPFMFGGIRRIEDVALFLWIISPQYDALDHGRLDQFVSELFLHPKFQLFFRGIDRYLERAFMDRPPVAQKGKTIAASYTASIIHRIASAYHWSTEEILDTPIARLFQYLKWINAEHNANTPQFNPFQDRVKSRLMR